ncbi:HAMP domain-containing sensor histidine kinase [Gordonia sp. NB41Y]|uniref:sensor histidine kinase n=1 Tax=Gordonia sp. NB41Y TaxID=875808 RepID=UPI0006B1588A|nr:HAMP domain-containing sensor histidine kinase [Gordonia sp. NB41Y]KOY48962.1 hypothetical protein ISGA_13315 [Gordonia sp. NB41Y]WLP89929.1 HAMP domain-containing sensor histidine kinase [Gordonia sp. NB41Y]
MRRRILAVLLCFSAFAIVAFALPLASATSAARTRDLGLARSADASYFAAVAGREPGSGSPLQSELDRYRELYGEGVLVVDSRGEIRASSGLDPTDPSVAEAISSALRNQRRSVGGRLTPVSDEYQLIATPVGSGTQVDGAVVLQVSTAAARRDIRNDWIVIAAGAVVALLVVAALAAALSRWIARPLERLTLRVGELTDQVPTTPGAVLVRPAAADHHGPPEVRALSRAFDTMSSAVRSSVDAQRQLVADTAHKLRNPLAALQIRLDTLGPSVPESARETHRRATAEVDRLGEILDGLLSLATAEVPAHGDGDEAEAVCTPATVVADRADAWSAALADNEMVLVVGEGLDVPVQMSGDRLGQVLDVLLSNSLRYAGQAATISVDADVQGTAGAEVRVSYRDDGVGVPAADLERLTERFYRGTTAEGSGTGLGLSIAATLVRTIGGRLELHAGDPTGLVVDLILPVARYDDPPENQR